MPVTVKHSTLCYQIVFATHLGRDCSPLAGSLGRGMQQSFDELAKDTLGERREPGSPAGPQHTPLSDSGTSKNGTLSQLPC